MAAAAFAANSELKIDCIMLSTLILKHPNRHDILDIRGLKLFKYIVVDDDNFIVRKVFRLTDGRVKREGRPLQPFPHPVYFGVCWTHY